MLAVRKSVDGQRTRRGCQANKNLTRGPTRGIEIAEISQYFSVNQW